MEYVRLRRAAGAQRRSVSKKSGGPSVKSNHGQDSAGAGAGVGVASARCIDLTKDQRLDNLVKPGNVWSRPKSQIVSLRILFFLTTFYFTH